MRLYEEFHGLRERPFDLAADPRFLQLTRSHQEALANLEYAISGRRGIVLLIGDAGTGKTTVLRRAIGDVQARAEIAPTCVSLNHPTLSGAEFLEFLAGGFGLSAAAHASKARFLREFEALLMARRADGACCVLVVDEAQSVSHELLEEVRLLANLEADGDKLLTLVLAGQPELARRLDESRLRQLKQRIALRCTLRPLTLQETGEYIAGRIRIAGGDAGWLFSRDAVIAVHRQSLGIPRVVSVICDNALLTSFALGRHPVDAAMVADVVHDFELSATSVPTGPRPLPDATPHNLRLFTPQRSAERRPLTAAQRLSEFLREDR